MRGSSFPFTDPAQRGFRGADRGRLAARKVDQLDVLEIDLVQRVQVEFRRLVGGQPAQATDLCWPKTPIRTLR